MATSSRPVELEIRCDDVEIICNDDAVYTYETVSSMWLSLLSGQSDLFTTFFCLARFFSDATKHEISLFCHQHSLSELWFFFRHTDQLTLQTLALVCLNVAAPYKHPELVQVLITPKTINALMVISQTPYEDLANEGMGLLACVCNYQEDIPKACIEKGIIDILLSAPVYLYYGSLLTAICSSIDSSMSEAIVECTKRCVSGSEVENVKAAFICCLILLRDENCAPEDALSIVNTGLQNLMQIQDQTTSTGVALKECCKILKLFKGEVPAENSELLFKLLIRMKESDNYEFTKCYAPVVEAFADNAEKWMEVVGTDFFEFLLASYQTVPYDDRMETCNFFLKVFPYTKEFSIDVINIFIDYMADANISVDCINALFAIIEAFPGNEKLYELLDRVDENVKDILSTETDDLVYTAADQLSTLLDSKK